MPGLASGSAKTQLGFNGGDTHTSRYCGNSPTNVTDPSGLASPINIAAEAAKEKAQIMAIAEKWFKTYKGGWPNQNCEVQALDLGRALGQQWKYWNIQGCSGWRWRFIYIGGWPYLRETENAVYVAPKNNNPLPAFVLDYFHDYDNSYDPSKMWSGSPEEFFRKFPHGQNTNSWKATPPPEPLFPPSMWCYPVKCFAPGTPVLCPDGAHTIESLREGDRVLAYDLGEQRIVESRVLRCDAFRGDFDMLEVTVSDGNHICVTTEHAFYNGYEWVPSSDIASYGPILDASGNRALVSAVGPMRCNGTTTYNLRTEHGTYLVGATGLVVADRAVWISRRPTTDQLVKL